MDRIRTKEFSSLLRLSGRNRGTTWTYFDRKEYRKYQLDSEPDKPRSMSDVPMIESGPHALSEVGKVRSSRSPSAMDCGWPTRRALAARALQ